MKIALNHTKLHVIPNNGRRSTLVQKNTQIKSNTQILMSVSVLADV